MGVVLGLAVFCLVIYLEDIGRFENWEHRVQDFRFRLRGPLKSRGNILVVAIDDRTFKELDERWPLPYHYYNALVRTLTKAGTRVIAFDLLSFCTPLPAEHRNQEVALAQAFSEHGNVVIGSKYTSTSESLEWEKPIIVFSKAARHGFLNLIQDRDGVIRRLAPLKAGRDGDEEGSGDEAVPAFSSLIAALYRQPQASPTTAITMKVHSGKGGIGEARTPQAPTGKAPTGDEPHPCKHYQIGDITVPSTIRDSCYIHHLGPAGETFVRVSLSDVVKGTIPPEFFKDRIVLVGATFSECHDAFLTPYFFSVGRYRMVPGIEIHGHAVEMMINGNYLARPKGPARIIPLLLAFAGVVSFILWLTPLKAFIFTLALALLHFLAGIVLFVTNDLWIETVPPLATMALVYLALATYKLFTEDIHRKKVKSIFSSYVNEGVVEKLMDDTSLSALKGELVQATILFSDIRGFTAMSEKMDPEELVSFLSEYFTAMGEIIYREEGTLDKFIGDAIMAIFGAPVHHDDDPLRAVRSAVLMKDELEKLNRKWKEQDLPQMDIGVGICTGPVVAGNVGSNRHVDYTVMGSTVNTASRLEGLNKRFKSNIIVDPVTFEQVRDMVEYEDLGPTAIRGMADPMNIYIIKGLKDTQPA